MLHRNMAGVCALCKVSLTDKTIKTRNMSLSSNPNPTRQHKHGVYECQ